MALEHRRVMTPEELAALYARLNELIDNATQIQRRLGKAISGGHRDARRVTSTRRPTQARRISRDPKSRN